MNKFEIQYIFESKKDFGGDEIGIKVLLNNQLLIKYGDYYHDKGSEKASAFIDGYVMAKEWSKKDYKVKSTKKADPDFY